MFNVLCIYGVCVCRRYTFTQMNIQDTNTNRQYYRLEAAILCTSSDRLNFFFSHLSFVISFFFLPKFRLFNSCAFIYLPRDILYIRRQISHEYAMNLYNKHQDCFRK